MEQLPRVRSEEVRYEVELFSKVTLDQNESFAADQNRSYTTLFSYQQRQENKAKFACLASEYQFRFCSQLLSIYFTLCLPRQRRQKCLLAPTNVTSDDARRRQFGVAVRPGIAGRLVDIECSRVRDSSWMYLTSFVTTRIDIKLAAVQRKLPDCVVVGLQLYSAR